MAGDQVAGYSSDYNDPFYSGVAVADSSIVPGSFPVAVNGRPYILNTDPQALEVYGDNFKEESLPLLRQQADQGRTAGEQSLSPSQFWRRSADTWHGGSGQKIYDREISDPNRFNESKGVNPWTRYQLSLLNGTANIRASANTGLVATSANAGFYVADGTSVVRTTDLSAFTTCTGTPGVAATALATNGIVAYAAFGASGVHAITGTVSASWNTGTVDWVGFAKGRLLAANANVLYNPLISEALGAGNTIHTIPTSGGGTAWRWNACAESDRFIYVSGFVGTVSRIYRFTIQPDGGGTTTLTAGIVAGTLPTGEIVRSMYGYLNFLVIGTDKGVRLATVTDNGDLTLGALIPTPAPVYCAEGLDRFIWFGWSNFDAASTGLGRMDLSIINDGFAPAYASDLMATGQGAVKGTGVIGTRRLFTVDGVGVFAEATTTVASGWVTSGQISFGLSDAKVPVFVDLKHAPLPATTVITVGMSVDRDVSATIGLSDQDGAVSPAEPISTGQRRCEEVELTFTLSGTAVGPVLTRWTLLAYPAPAGASTFTLPLILAEKVTTWRDVDLPMDPVVEYEFLRGLHDSREIITVQVGEVTFQGTLEEFTWVPNRHTDDFHWWNGTFIAKIRRIAG